MNCSHSSLAVEICAVCLDDMRLALADAQSKLDAAEKSVVYWRDRCGSIEPRLDESMKDAAALRAKGRAAWEVLERYFADVHKLNINAMPGSDDMMIALTGIRFLPPDEADMKWAEEVAARVVERQTNNG